MLQQEVWFVLEYAISVHGEAVISNSRNPRKRAHLTVTFFDFLPSIEQQAQFA